MIPLRVVAALVTRLLMPQEGYFHLDAIVMAAQARALGLPPLLTMREAAEAPELPIPIAKSECGRYYLASANERVEPVARETRWVNRRFPTQEAIAFGGDKIARIETNAGLSKAFRIPAETQHIERLTWWCIGEPGELRALLSLVSRLGKRRVAGEGLVREWSVEPCERWDDGFPVLRDGLPTRHLPLDAHGLGDGYEMREGRLRPPYWCRLGEEWVACP